MTSEFKSEAVLSDFKRNSQTAVMTVQKVPPASLTMADWKKTGWEPPKSFGPFPLRAVSPDVVDFLVAAKHFSVRDLRSLVDYLQIDVDPKEPAAVYDALLDRVEPAPWTLPIIEVAVSERRLKANGLPSPRRREKAKHILTKLPLSKLRLKNNPTLQDRVLELRAEGQMAADIAVAAFCEYAIEAYFRRVDTHDGDKVVAMAYAHLTQANTRQESAQEILGDLDDVDNWPAHGHKLIATATEHPDLASSLVQQHLVSTLHSLAADLDISSGPDEFDLVSNLALLASDQAAKTSQVSIDALLFQLNAIGIDAEAIQVNDQTASILRKLNASGVLREIEYVAKYIIDLEQASGELRGRIKEANETENFELLAELATQARETKARLSELRDNHERRMRGVRSVVEGEIAAIDVLPEGMRMEIESTAHDAEDIEAPIAERIDSQVNRVADQPTAEAAIAALEASYKADSDTDHEDAQPQDSGEINEEAHGVPVKTGGIDCAASESTDDVSVKKEGVHADAVGHETETVTVEALTEAPQTQQQETLASGLSRYVIAENGDSQPPQGGASPAPVGSDVLAALISRDLVGIAADAAEAFEAEGFVWPIEAPVLRAAAGCRGPHREYGQDSQRFLTITSRATSLQLGDLGSVMLLGALVRPAILEQSSAYRAGLLQRARGALGKHLQEAAGAIAALDYDFPPAADELARISGAQSVPQRKRISDQLDEWCLLFSQKTSRWHFATYFLHHVVSDNGLIGAARAAIAANSKDAVRLARKAISQLKTQSEIEARSIEFATETGHGGARLYPKGIEYLDRQFDEPLGLLDSWVRAAEREGTHSQKSEARLRRTISNLQSRFEKAARALREDADQGGDPLRCAVAHWIALQIDEARHALEGADTGTFTTLEEALSAERDLLPAATRGALDDPEERFDALTEVLLGSGIPEPETALLRSREEAAFDTAARLAARFGIDASEDIRQDMAAFSDIWRVEVERRERRLKTLAKVDHKHQEKIARNLNWCSIALDRLTAIRDGAEVHDLADIPAHIRELDEVSGAIEANIRLDQAERINQYCTEQNVDEANALLSAIDDLTIEAVEDRIAQLRDGRSAATFETELEGLLKEFTPGFVSQAIGPDWPKSIDAYKAAFEIMGPLFLEEDRRAAGTDFVGLYLDIARSIRLKKPLVSKVREFFEEIGFENFKTHNLQSLGRTNSWHATISAKIESKSGNWFLPPVFGSKATAGYHLLIIGPETLPEAILKAVSSEMPAILLFLGVADLARRHEYAKRLRANAIPALLIDEALVAFTATQRDTRAKTIFECGLPYGRVEPYVTDAATVPEEMFFGREEEIRNIMSKTADGCLVYGGRQLGKSALLNHISTTCNAPAQSRIVLKREVKSLGNAERTFEIWSHLSAMLSPYDVVKPASRTADAISHDIRAWIMTHPQGQIVCMFDETDHFMAADTKDDYPELSRLKELMEDTGRAFKVVFAGLHNVQRMDKQPNSPLAHLGQPICIGPLNRTEDDKRVAHDLVVEPMRAAGFRFESLEAVEAILAWANYYPSLVQEYSKGLLATLHGAGSGKPYRLSDDGPLWVILTESLFAHRGFHAIETRIRQKFHWTLELDPRYALVAYTLARLNIEGNEQQSLVTGFRPSELLLETLTFWPKTAEHPSQASFDALLQELFDLGVLGRVPIPNTNRHTYLLRTRQVAAMLGSEEDIDHALLEIVERDPTISYDRAIHRRRYAPAGHHGYNQQEWPYAPLTDLQIERIVDPNAVPMQIVCGLEILGLSKVGAALKQIAAIGRLPGAPKDDITVHVVTSRKELGTLIGGPAAVDRCMSLVVHTPASPQEAAEELAWIERQPRVVENQVRPVVILDAADEDMRGLASRRKDQAQFLSAWGGEMVRAHLQQIEKTDLDTPAFRKAILETTGGLPTETIKLIRAMSLASDPTEVVRTWAISEKLPVSFFKGALGQALRLIEVAEKDDYQALDELMCEEIGQDLETIGPDLLAIGLVVDWNAKARRIRRSALGDLIAQTLETQYP
ncbi:ATP-binding protein [Breoghania sp. L-A4]|uniref:ATP-binding protein n=1 Tax=Breoghania sp. L-A4 TaxID=2304600 RepID=UPI000E35C36B|nr:ATP-binding protein [Breoghania sp. L-A4]AXS40979.1 ATP-binding protein [Breoghania sp. L-A4]